MKGALLLALIPTLAMLGLIAALALHGALQP